MVHREGDIEHDIRLPVRIVGQIAAPVAVIDDGATASESPSQFHPHRQRRRPQRCRVDDRTDGTGITDAETLKLALTAANRVTHEILEGLAATDLRGACPNALVAHPAGILQGVDQEHTGRVERVDIGLLRALLDNDIIPVLPPLGSDGEGATYRLNSDNAALEVARALQAVKLIYLTTQPGIMIRWPSCKRADSVSRFASTQPAEPAPTIT